jgi:hypothetical protein
MRWHRHTYLLICFVHVCNSRLLLNYILTWHVSCFKLIPCFPLSFAYLLLVVLMWGIWITLLYQHFAWHCRVLLDGNQYQVCL